MTSTKDGLAAGERFGECQGLALGHIPEVLGEGLLRGTFKVRPKMQEASGHLSGQQGQGPGGENMPGVLRTSKEGPSGRDEIREAVTGELGSALPAAFGTLVAAWMRPLCKGGMCPSDSKWRMECR